VTNLRPPGNPLPEMTPTELNERMDRGDPVVLVDVREEEEREIADLPDWGQRWIPLGELMTRMEELDPEESIVLYCRSGARSGWATRQMMARGYGKVWNLQGGLLRWRQDIDPSMQEY
jgi:sulfur-carrier protein adenylyltransferase/sulfurtransferase